MTDDNQTLVNHITRSIEITLHPEEETDAGGRIPPAGETCTHIPADVHALLAEAVEKERLEKTRRETEERKRQQQHDAREIPHALFALD